MTFVSRNPHNIELMNWVAHYVSKKLTNQIPCFFNLNVIRRIEAHSVTADSSYYLQHNVAQVSRCR